MPGRWMALETVRIDFMGVSFPASSRVRYLYCGASDPVSEDDFAKPRHNDQKCIVWSVVTYTRGRMRSASVSRLPAGSLTSAEVLMGRGLSRPAIGRLVLSGALVPEPGARGVYRIDGRELSMNHDLMVAALYAPSGVFCLLTALRWHGLRGPCPDVWLCVPARSRFPDLKQLPIAKVRPQIERADWEVETRVVEEVPMRFTSPAQTVADCFQHRTRVGLDIAIAALQTALSSRAATIEDIWRCAKAGRVHGVMLPYMESIG